ncbi:MAG: cache domain-containing protein, partial [Chromatiales bacterium]
DRGMMIRLVYPVLDLNGVVVALLDGGVLLNRNFPFVDAIRDLVYGPGSLPEGSIGTVTVFLEDVRITTNVPMHPGERALGTRVSREVREHVLGRGKKWIDRAFVVNDWYISAYEPIIDVNGRRVGMLYAGFLETPFRLAWQQALTLLLILYFVVIAFSIWLAVRGARTIFRPLEAMASVVRATKLGKNRRIGPIESDDELGELASQFDDMLDRLQEHSRRLEEAAEQLEVKVQKRTAELSSRNEELEQTVRLLRETRRQLVTAEKLAALGELTAGVAHEINNPTAVILGHLDLLVSELGDAAEPHKREIDLIIEQVYRIRSIVNNLLQYARPAVYVGELQDVDVNALVQDTLVLVDHLLRASGAQVERRLQASKTIRINRQELQQVLVNLISNAAHAIGRGGRVEILTEDWDCGVCVTVSDDGTGIPEDHLGRVFDPFFTTKSDGTGLGLSITYGIVRRYGGDITVESAPGEGARFQVVLTERPSEEAGQEMDAVFGRVDVERRVSGSG